MSLYKSDSKPTMAAEEEELRLIGVQIQSVDEEIEKLQNRKQRLLEKKEQLKNILQQKENDKLANRNWETSDFPWTTTLTQTLNDTFKIQKFRPLQLSTINATLSGHDVILIMPTGGGKSLCYQLPALITDGITLVVSPLVSLMEDQIMALKKLGVNAELLNANSTKEEVNAVQSAMTDKNTSLKLLYVTPEKLAKSKRFMTKLQKMHSMKNFARLAIDEVHCCSQWGHDFRPDYKFLGVMRSLFPGVPILGLTATSTARVTEDVKKMLNLSSCIIFKASFNRPNLYYEVRRKPPSPKECIDELAELLQKRFANQSGIIYTTTIKDCDELSGELRKKKLRVAAYHANLDAGRRSQVHNRWVSNEYQAVVATIAFGMGIDKPDVRFVIHHSISKSMENFYQESGRAGRDEQKANCIVYWKLSDLFKLSTMVFTERTGLNNLYAMAAYCIDPQRCRRQIIAEHFDEAWQTTHCKSMCDHCSGTNAIGETNIGPHFETLKNIIEKATVLDVRLTAQKLVDAWFHKGQANLRLPDRDPPALPRDVCEDILAHLLIEGFLKEDFHFTPYSTISYIVTGERGSYWTVSTPIKFKMSGGIEAVVGSSTTKAKKRRKIEDVVISSDSD